MVIENQNHGKILDKILKEKKIKKTEFAISLGYTKNNYTNSLNKPNYSEKMIEKVSTALGVEPTVFTITAVNGDNHGVVMQTITPSERIAELESRLRDKEEIIEGLRDKLRRYEDAQMN